MAKSRSLPTGFGELEVMAVGIVLLVEGEPGRAWGGMGTQRAPRNQTSAVKLANHTTLCLDPRGNSDGCTCGMQFVGWESRERGPAKVREEGTLRGEHLPRA